MAEETNRPIARATGAGPEPEPYEPPSVTDIETTESPAFTAPGADGTVTTIISGGGAAPERL